MYYACKNHKRGESSCGMKSIRKGLLEDVVFRALRNILKKESIVNKMVEKLYERHQELAYDNPNIQELINNKEIIESSVASLSKTVAISPSKALSE